MTSVLDDLRPGRPLFWSNPRLAPAADVLARLPWTAASIAEAQARWQRWQPALARLFPELAAEGGRIESLLAPLPSGAIQQLFAGLPGRFLAKQDHALPVAGSIKARGGIHEVLCVAEDTMAEAGIDFARDPLAPLSTAARDAFARRTVAVGSTGNLGLSIGVAASALGFRSVVHMSAIAKPWKKERLRRRGVQVREHAGDFTAAVAAGRAETEADPAGYFVDDEHSLRLFLGYATAARGLAAQLQELGIQVGPAHPLFVYLPCGVGGAPSGIVFGLKQLWGDHVHCFLAEPCAAPSMLARLAAQRPISVYELGLDNRTQADGLAVAQASELAAEALDGLVSGGFTVDDDALLATVAQLHEHAGLQVEPSATAGFPGPQWLLGSHEGRRYLERRQLAPQMASATHVLWTTGGLFVPAEEHERHVEMGRRVLDSQG